MQKYQQINMKYKLLLESYRTAMFEVQSLNILFACFFFICDFDSLGGYLVKFWFSGDLLNRIESVIYHSETVSIFCKRGISCVPYHGHEMNGSVCMIVCVYVRMQEIVHLSLNVCVCAFKWMYLIIHAWISSGWMCYK